MHATTGTLLVIVQQQPAETSASMHTKPGPSGAGGQKLIPANRVSPVTYFDAHSTQTLNNPNIGGTATGNYYLNPAAFSADFSYLAPGEFTYGSSGRNAYRGPDRINVDLSVAKTTEIKERAKLEIRADFFNALNHTEFQLPNTNIGSTNFGQISSTYDPRIIQLAARLTF